MGYKKQYYPGKPSSAIEIVLLKIIEGSGSFCNLPRYVNNPHEKRMNSTIRVRNEWTESFIITGFYADFQK